MVHTYINTLFLNLNKYIYIYFVNLGERGRSGEDGEPGKDGRDGAPGLEGNAGADGAKGARGMYNCVLSHTLTLIIQLCVICLSANSLICILRIV